MSALKICKDCGHGVSKTADVCPSCGARLKRRWYEVGMFTTVLVLGTMLLMIFGIVGSQI